MLPPEITKKMGELTYLPQKGGRLIILWASTDNMKFVINIDVYECESIHSSINLLILTVPSDGDLKNA